jgi:hypothetical protein
MGAGLQHADGFGVLSGGNSSGFVKEGDDIALASRPVREYEGTAPAGFTSDIEQRVLSTTQVRGQRQVVRLEPGWLSTAVVSGNHVVRAS